tara:strand:- start:325 stop:468 length:144 start_codon:yes stop_codon:yes gene_type:complete
LSKISAYTKNIGRSSVDIIKRGKEDREEDPLITGLAFLRAEDKQILR